jgi:hypothetical protein
MLAFFFSISTMSRSYFRTDQAGWPRVLYGADNGLVPPAGYYNPTERPQPVAII